MHVPLNLHSFRETWGGQAARVEIECVSPPGLLASTGQHFIQQYLYNTIISATCNRPRDCTERLRKYFNSPTSTEQQNKNMRILSKFYQPFIYPKYKLSTWIMTSLHPSIPVSPGHIVFQPMRTLRPSSCCGPVKARRLGESLDDLNRSR